MGRHYPRLPWCRYADDGLIHCHSQAQARQVMEEPRQRLQDRGLELHPDKTRIVYCKDDNRSGDYPVRKFDFPGYTFRGRSVRNARDQKNFVGFTPAVSNVSKKAMRGYLRASRMNKHLQGGLWEIARGYNPVLRGWLEYYGKYGRSEMKDVFTSFNKMLIKWLMRKYQRFRGHKTRASRYAESLCKYNKKLFVHWEQGIVGRFA